MKNLKKFELYTGSGATDLMSEFLTWLGDKIGFKIGEYLGGGIAGSVYEIDKHRVIKLTYSNVFGEQYLSSRNVDGLVKIYQTGVIEAPKRFKYPNGSKPNDYSYSGINLLNPERTNGRYDTKIGYVVMERLRQDDKLEKDLKYIDSNIWYDGFAKGDLKTVKDDKSGLNKQEFFFSKPNDYHQETIEIIKDSTLNGFGRWFLRNIFSQPNNENFINDSRKYIEQNESRKYVKIFDRLVAIAKNAAKLNLDWDDVHTKQFAYNSKGQITALDVSFGLGKYVYDDDGKIQVIPNKEKENARNKKVKNVIREEKSYISRFEKFNEETSVGKHRREKLSGRSQVIDMDNIKDVLEKYASWYDVNCKTPLYRGLKSNDLPREDNFLILDPSTYDRNSVDTDNYYNLIMDNMPKWFEYPKRSKSIIGSLDKSTAEDYGNLYRVIPIFENSKVAIAPKFDIWWSFDRAFRNNNPMYTECENCDGTGDDERFNTVCASCGGSGDIEVTSLKQFNDKLKKDFRLDKNKYTWNEFKNKVKNALPIIKDIFDPSANGFRLIDYNNDTNIHKDAEIWTEAKCLLIREDLLNP